MADKSAYVPPEALDGGIKKDSSDVDLDDVDFFAKPAPSQEKKPVIPQPVVIPPPPQPVKTQPEPPKKPTIVYKKATTYQKTFAGGKK
uniref:Calpain inhibitor n=1 Tax=Strongyloides stercoralis TaxID=6248 RepID=A0A0K0E6Q5_STRER